MGLHDLPEDACSPAGLIVLQVSATDDELQAFLQKLNALDDVRASSLAM
ncbi:hypothetical protein L21SP2_0592 [Salinispira pacifica]|uniref:ACT domain-containing protein n=1 Tax=Salinispira pacifica TaxID=1307761 RepID=V5WFU9_9SPIO|nr:hypothetical protein L21SP2_0592 [Salinispira pacifica]